MPFTATPRSATTPASATAGELALSGGEPVRRRPFTSRATIGDEEKAAVLEVLDSGCLSAFYGSPGPEFLGGAKVRAFEAQWAGHFDYRHAVTVNSWTSGLIVAAGAIGLEPGDEVICPPYTMSASATSVLFWGAIPVFADIDAETFCLDPAAVEARLSPRTKAIMVVHLFGCPADMDRIGAIASRHGLRVIEDAAQAPGALWRGRPVGALADIGGFSLNYHKHIHTGEGGVIVSDDDDLALRCQLIRNHGENVVDDLGIEDIRNIVGANYRLTELQAAIGIEQLGKLDGILDWRRGLAHYLRPKLDCLPGISIPAVPEAATHSYYVYPMKYDARVTGVSRDLFVKAVNAELPEAVDGDSTALAAGYVEPLYLSPLFQRRIALGGGHFPFSLNPDGPDYAKGCCPVTERVQEHELMLSSIVRDPLTPADMDDFVAAIEKVLDNLDQLRAIG